MMNYLNMQAWHVTRIVVANANLFYYFCNDFVHATRQTHGYVLTVSILKNIKSQESVKLYGGS
jgi:hypothetical protein